jgi:hypothetical protein
MQFVVRGRAHLAVAVFSTHLVSVR